MRSSLRAALCLAAILPVACTDELGVCQSELAEQVVYGPNGWAATKGQALVHESCGGGNMCHSTAATGKARWGARAGFNFDMLPDPTGWESIMAYRYEAWDMVRAGAVPPTSAQTQLPSGAWKFSPGRELGAKALPSIFSYEGKAYFRNWLACGGPVVGQPPVHFAPPPSASDEDGGEPDPGQDGGLDAGPSNPLDWEDIYKGLVKPRCALSTCHDDSMRAGELSMTSECTTLASLKEEGPCHMTRVVPGDADASFLYKKLSSDDPGCGSRMPVGAPLSDTQLATVRTWIEDGATAENCP